MKKYQVYFAKENERYPFYEYARSLVDEWTVGFENAAVGIFLKAQEIEVTGVQGDVETQGCNSIYLARYRRHRIAHVPHPEDPSKIFILTAFEAHDPNGEADAWRLLHNIIQ